MLCTPTAIPGVRVLEPKVFGDERGFFCETWNRRSFAALGIDMDFVQDNHSRSAQGILRGLHYQTTQVQGKLVRVSEGEIFDVSVDLRRDSPTFGKWVGVLLSASNRRMLWIPPGFAHGFYVTGQSADVLYKCTDFYDPASEVSIRWDDPEIGIDWPLVGGVAPTLSAKDAKGLPFREAPTL
ncbi:MAG: dTDP-4-dehydrorhamnose 3,5-epimerase [Gammaproteobacteria bacterium]